MSVRQEATSSVDRKEIYRHTARVAWRPSSPPNPDTAVLPSLHPAKGRKGRPGWKEERAVSRAELSSIKGLTATAVSRVQASMSEEEEGRGRMRRPVGLEVKMPPPELVAVFPLTLVDPKRAVLRQPAIDWAEREAREFKWGWTRAACETE